MVSRISTDLWRDIDCSDEVDQLRQEIDDLQWQLAVQPRYRAIDFAMVGLAMFVCGFLCCGAMTAMW